MFYLTIKSTKRYLYIKLLILEFTKSTLLLDQGGPCLMGSVKATWRNDEVRRGVTSYSSKWVLNVLKNCNRDRVESQ